MLTLLDKIKPSPALNSAAKNLLRWAPAARRYIFDSEASTRLGEMLRDHMDLLVDNIEFARAPYPNTYLELDFRAMFRAWRGPDSLSPTADHTLGFMLHGETAMSLVDSPTHGALSFMLGFRVNQPQRIPVGKLFANGLISEAINSRTGLYEAADPETTGFFTKAAFVLGGERVPSTKHPGGTDLRMQYWGDKWTLEQVASHFDVWPTYQEATSKENYEAAHHGSGDPIICMAALLLLNQPTEFITVEKQERRKQFYKGRHLSYKEHHVVSVSLSQREKIVRNWQRTDRASPLLHDVEGHWKNYNKAKIHCEHEWEPLGPELTSSGQHKHYWCPRCFQRRTWTEAFVRGDAERGVATKHYEVRK